MKNLSRLVAGVGVLGGIAALLVYFGGARGGVGQKREAAVAATRPAAETAPQPDPVSPMASAEVPGSVESAAAAPLLAPFRYAQRWDGTLAPALAAFRDWTQRYLSAGSPAERSALEREGIALARARRPVLRTIIERDPEAALAMTVPATIRAGLPAAVLAELEERFSVRGDFTVLVFDYDAAELARRRVRGLPTETLAYTVAWDGKEYPAFVYGRRAGMVTKHGLPLHGILLDGAVALHDRALRVLEPGEAVPADIEGSAVAMELAGRVLGVDAAAEVLRDEARLQAAEQGIGPALREVPTAAGPMAPDAMGGLPSGTGANAAAPATAWTVGTKNVLVIRVDFSDLAGDPRRGSTIYTADYVKNLTDTQVAPFYAQSSYGKTALVTTVSTNVYRMPQTAAYYAAGELNSQLHTDARNLAAADFSLNSFDRILVLFSSLSGLSNSKITYGGLANVGGKNSWINGAYDFRVVAHELGHTYGLMHANLWLVTDGNPVSAGGTNSEYGDIYDTMGANFTNDRRTDFNPWFKNLLGWVTDAQVNPVSTNGTFRINRLDNSTGTGTLGLKIARDGTRSVWVGTRRSFTTNTSMQEGAYVIWGYNTNTGSHLLDLNTPGSSVNDAALAPDATLLDVAGNLSIRHAGNGGTSPDEYLDVQVTLGLNGLPTFSAHPQGQGYNVGDNVTLTATVTGTAPLAYQWLRNGSAISGATNLSFAITNAPAGAAGSYALRVSNSVGTVTSNPAVLAVNGPPVVFVPPANTATAAGRPVSLTVTAEGAPTPTYQWRKGGTILTGQTGSALSFTSVQATDAGSYEVELKNSFGTVIAGPVALTVNAGGTPPSNDAFAAGWVLTGDAGVAQGTNSGATGEAGEPIHVSTGGTATSVWYRFVPSFTGTAQVDTIGSSFDTVLAVYTGSSVGSLTKVGDDDQGGGLNTSLLRFAVTAGVTYHIAVGAFSSGSSGEIKLNYAVYQAPTIATPPVAQIGTLGGNASFSVTAQGTAPRYQWFRDGQPIEGATRATLALGPLGPVDAGVYSVLVSNPAGSVVSASATLSSSNAAPTITTQPSAVNAVAGQPATLSVVATGDAPLAYQWSRRGQAIAGATAATFTLPSPTRSDADYYEVRAISGLTYTTSQRVRLTVAPSTYPTLVAPDPDWELRPESSGGLGYAVAPLADGRAYIAGQFVSLGGVRRAGIARLNADGSLDTTFLPPELDNTVRAVAVQADGKVVIAGEFVRVNGFVRNRIARLNPDGSIDAGFDTGTGANASVNALVLAADGKIVVGGTFEGFAGTNRDHLVRLNTDGSVDATFLNRGVTNWVRALAMQADGKLIAGGDFVAGFVAADGTTITRTRLVRINPDGTLDTAFNPAANNMVMSLLVQSDGKILVGGLFTTLAGSTVTRFGRLEASGALDAAFTAAGGTGFSPTGSSLAVNALALQADGQILVGGTFSGFNGTSLSNFARLSGSGARDTTYQSRGFNGTVFGVAVLPSGQIVAGGGFSSYLNSSSLNTTRANFARMNADGTLDNGVNFTVRRPGSISAMVVQPDGKVLIGGFFTSLRGATVPTGVARVNPDGTVDTAFNSGGSGSNSNVYALLLQPDGRVVITGAFSTYNGSAARGIARLKTDGTLDSSFAIGEGFGGTGTGFTLAAMPDGRIFVGGSFTTVDSRPRGRVAVLLPNGSVDSSFAPASGAGGSGFTVYASAIQPDGKILVGGSFSAFNGTAVPYIARLQSSGALDPAFVPGTGPDNWVYALALQSDGMVIVGGAFTVVSGSARGGVARLRSDGGLDPAFVPPDLVTTNAVHVQEDDKVLVRGSFSTAGGEGSAYLTRLTTSGARDTTFLAGGFTPASSTGGTFASRLVMGDSGRIFMQSNGSAGMSATEATTLPVITVPPAAAAVGVGATATFSVTASSALPITYQWLRNGAPLAGETKATLTIVNAQPVNEGNYSVRLTSELGSVTSGAAALLVGAAPGLAGTSALGQLIGGLHEGAFTVEGSTAKAMLVRAIGPALSVSDALADPRVEIVATATGAVVAANDDWQSAANATRVQQIANQLGLTALAAGSKDAAILATLNPGTYRVRIGGPAGASGRAVLEVYEADSVPRLVYAATNLYLNAAAGTVNFVTSLPPAGRSYLIRALGPSLGSVSALADPRLLVRSGTTQIAQNDDWGGAAEIVAAAATAGVLPLAADSKDAAAVVVPPTASPLAVEVFGPAGASGFVWVEVCEVDAARAATVAPAILVGPERRTVAPGDSVSFGVVAVGKPGPTVQWRKGGLPLVGATGGVLRIGTVTAADAGLYDAVVGNGSQTVTSAAVPLEVVTATQTALTGGYAAGAPFVLTNQFGTTATGRSLSWDVVLPAGWTFVSDTSSASSKPAAGATGTLRWSWATVPEAGVSFTYTLQVPAGETGPQIRPLGAVLTLGGSGPTTLFSPRPAPLQLLPANLPHTADTNGDFRLGLAELTRVIELFNTRNNAVRTGAYRVDAAGEDGFAVEPTRAAGVTATLTRHHAADANRDGSIGLLELTRVIQLYNLRSGTVRTGAYRVQSGSEDGYAPAN